VNLVLASILIATILLANAEYYSYISDNLLKHVTNAHAQPIPFFPSVSNLDNLTRAGDTTTEIEFEPWGNENNLTLTKAENKTALDIPSAFKIVGSTGSETAGFYSPGIIYEGKNISLSFDKLPTDSPMTIAFNILGASGDYQLIFVNGAPQVNGTSEVDGRVDNRYYQRINSSSPVLVNFDKFVELFGDNYILVNGIWVGVPKETSIGPTVFKIGLDDAGSTNP
jgi:hypothetical protein